MHPELQQILAVLEQRLVSADLVQSRLAAAESEAFGEALRAEEAEGRADRAEARVESLEARVETQQAYIRDLEAREREAKLNERIETERRVRAEALLPKVKALLAQNATLDAQIQALQRHTAKREEANAATIQNLQQRLDERDYQFAIVDGERADLEHDLTMSLTERALLEHRLQHSQASVRALEHAVENTTCRLQALEADREQNKCLVDEDYICPYCRRPFRNWSRADGAYCCYGCGRAS